MKNASSFWCLQHASKSTRQSLDRQQDAEKVSSNKKKLLDEHFAFG